MADHGYGQASVQLTSILLGAGEVRGETLAVRLLPVACPALPLFRFVLIRYSENGQLARDTLNSSSRTALAKLNADEMFRCASNEAEQYEAWTYLFGPKRPGNDRRKSSRD